MHAVHTLVPRAAWNRFCPCVLSPPTYPPLASGSPNTWCPCCGSTTSSSSWVHRRRSTTPPTSAPAMALPMVRRANVVLAGVLVSLCVYVCSCVFACVLASLVLSSYMHFVHKYALSLHRNIVHLSQQRLFELLSLPPVQHHTHTRSRILIRPLSHHLLRPKQASTAWMTSRLTLPP